MKRLDRRTGPRDGRREPVVDGERGTLLHLACRLAVLLSANACCVHAVIKRKVDATRAGHPVSQADPRIAGQAVAEQLLGRSGGH